MSTPLINKSSPSFNNKALIKKEQNKAIDQIDGMYNVLLHQLCQPPIPGEESAGKVSEILASMAHLQSSKGMVDSFKSLSENMLNICQNASLLGRSIKVDGNIVNTNSDKIHLTFSIPNTAKTPRLEIVDEKGKVVYSRSLTNSDKDCIIKKSDLDSSDLSKDLTFRVIDQDIDEESKEVGENYRYFALVTSIEKIEEKFYACVDKGKPIPIDQIDTIKFSEERNDWIMNELQPKVKEYYQNIKTGTEDN